MLSTAQDYRPGRVRRAVPRVAGDARRARDRVHDASQERAAARHRVARRRRLLDRHRFDAALGAARHGGHPHLRRRSSRRSARRSDSRTSTTRTRTSRRSSSTRSCGTATGRSAARATATSRCGRHARREWRTYDDPSDPFTHGLTSPSTSSRRAAPTTSWIAEVGDAATFDSFAAFQAALHRAPRSRSAPTHQCRYTSPVEGALVVRLDGSRSRCRGHAGRPPSRPRAWTTRSCTSLSRAAVRRNPGASRDARLRHVALEPRRAETYDVTVATRSSMCHSSPRSRQPVEERHCVERFRSEHARARPRARREQLERDDRVDRGLPDDGLRVMRGPSSRRCRRRGTGTPRAVGRRSRFRVTHVPAQVRPCMRAPRVAGSGSTAATTSRGATVDAAHPHRRGRRQARSCRASRSTSMNSSPSPYLNVTRSQSTQRGIEHDLFVLDVHALDRPDSLGEHERLGLRERRAA